MKTQIIISIAVMAVVYLSIYVWSVSGYELTKNDTDEGKILQICMNSDITLDYCNFIYGGKNYGDKIQ